MAACSLPASTSATTLPGAIEQLPLRSCLKTARKTQPWPWKSANCVCFSLRVQLGDVGEELGIGPVAAGGRLVGVAHRGAA